MRDADNIMMLTGMGWKVITVWECKFKKDKRADTLNGILFELEKQYGH